VAELDLLGHPKTTEIDLRDRVLPVIIDPEGSGAGDYAAHRTGRRGQRYSPAEYAVTSSDAAFANELSALNVHLDGTPTTCSTPSIASRGPFARPWLAAEG